MIDGKYLSDAAVQQAEAEDVSRILADCYKSKKTFAKLIFPERFNLPFSPKIHDPIFDILDDKTAKHVVIIAPRGCGKTSSVNFVGSAHGILFREYKFIVPISMSATHAIIQSENLKRKLLTNSRVLRLFGSIKLHRPRELEQFSKEQWLTEADPESGWPGTLVFPRGSGQEIRGFLHGDSRPDLILIDDLEDPRDLLSEDQRAKQKDWFFGSVLGAVSQKQAHRIIMVGSLLHENSLIALLAEDPNWLTLKLELCDEDYNSNWPEYMSTAKVKQLVQLYKSQERLNIFLREYRGILVLGKEAKFQEAFFRYYEECDLDLNENQNVESFILVDPAKTTRSLDTSDSAIDGVGFNYMTNSFYFRDSVVGKLRPDQLIDESFAMAERLGARVIGVEVTGLEDYIFYPFQSEALRRGRNIEIVELKAKGHKLDRIAALIPYYRQGRVSHNKHICGRLEEQLLSYPYSRKTDVMDAFAYIIPLLETGRRYFSFEGGGDEKRESQEAIEHEYDDIYAECDPARGNQRVA